MTPIKWPTKWGPTTGPQLSKILALRFQIAVTEWLTASTSVIVSPSCPPSPRFARALSSEIEVIMKEVLVVDKASIAVVDTNLGDHGGSSEEIGHRNG